MSKKRPDNEGIFENTTLWTGAVAGSAFLGLTVWAISLVGNGKEEKTGPAGPSRNIAMPSQASAARKLPSAHDGSEAGASALNVAKLKESGISEGFITADNITELDGGLETARDASSADFKGTLDELRQMQGDAKDRAARERAAEEPEGPADPVKKGSFEMISPLSNKNYVAMGGAAIAAGKAGAAEGPLSAQQAAQLQAAESAAPADAAGPPPDRAYSRAQFVSALAALRGGEPSQKRSGEVAAQRASEGSTAVKPLVSPGVTAPGPSPAAGGAGAGLGSLAKSSMGKATALGGGVAPALGVGGGGASGHNAPAPESANPSNVKKKTWRALEGQATDILGVANDYYEAVVKHVFVHEDRKVPDLQANMKKADAVLASLAKTAENAKGRSGGDPAARDAIAAVSMIIEGDQRPLLRSANAEMSESLGEIGAVPGMCRRYVTMTQTIFHDQYGQVDEYHQKVNNRLRRDLEKQGWQLTGGRWSKTQSVDVPLDPRKGALASHERLYAALESVQRVHELANAAAMLAQLNMPAIAKGMGDPAASQALLDFMATVSRDMEKIAELLPTHLLVGKVGANLGPLKEEALKGRLRIQNLDKRIKGENLRFPETARRDRLQGEMTAAVGDSSAALAHSSQADKSLMALVQMGKSATAAYLDLCDARLSFEDLSKTAKK